MKKSGSKRGTQTAIHTLGIALLPVVLGVFVGGGAMVATLAADVARLKESIQNLERLVDRLDVRVSATSPRGTIQRGEERLNQRIDRLEERFVRGKNIAK